MIDIDERVTKILEYLLDNTDIGESGISSIKTSIAIIHETAPTDIPIIFRTMDRIISASENLSWTVLVLRRHKYYIQMECKNIKDPEFTALTRRGRPSTTAIESEIRFNNSQLSALECQIDTLAGIIDYLQHIELCLDRKLWSLKDRISMSKM